MLAVIHHHHHHHRGCYQLLLVLVLFACLTFASPQVSAAASEADAVNTNENRQTTTRRKVLRLPEDEEQQRGTTVHQSRYLQEILMGRCYERPPTGNHQDDSKCPSLMGSITGVIMGNSLDQDVTMTSFAPYFDSGDVDFTSPRDSAVLTMMMMMMDDDPTVASSFFLLQQQQQGNTNGMIPTTFVTPETTHGGAILANLVFCGSNVRDNSGTTTTTTRDDCRWSQTRLSFWQGAYSHFASHVQGHLRIFLPPHDDTTTTTTSTLQDDWFKALVLDAGIAKLNVTAISGISIYSPSAPCTESKMVSQVNDALTMVGVSSSLVTCTQNVFSMVFTKNTTTTCQQGGGTNSEENNAMCKCLQQDPTITASSSSSSTTKTSIYSTTSSQENQKVDVENGNGQQQPIKRNHYTLFFFLTVVPFAGGYIFMANRMKRAAATYDRVHDVSY